MIIKKRGIRLIFPRLLTATIMMGLLSGGISQLNPGTEIIGQAWGALSERALPEFPEAAPQRWVNSKPLKKADVKGKVVLIEIWTST